MFLLVVQIGVLGGAWLLIGYWLHVAGCCLLVGGFLLLVT
jgi:hypothetical protein